MTDTDGTRDGSAAGGARTGAPAHRPAWPSLRGDDPTGGTPRTTPAGADGGAAATGTGPAVGTGTGAIPTRRQLRTGAIPVVPSPATGAAADAVAPAGPSAAARPSSGPVPGGPVRAGSAPADPASPAAAAPAGDAERRAAWTHPRLVGQGAGAAAAGASPAGTPADDTAADGTPAVGTPAVGTPADDGGDDPAADGTLARRLRWPLVAGIVAAVLVAGGAGTAFVLGRDDAGTATAGPAVVLPSPTASVAPAARPATTPFASALPATVLQYALASSADDADWLGRGALEAYAETYTDGGAGQVTVQAGQWETPEEADGVLAALAAELPAQPDAAAETTSDAATGAADPSGPRVLRSEEVLVGDQATGTVTVVDAGDGTGVALWRNGTTVFRVTGPAAEIADLYAAYPL